MENGRPAMTFEIAGPWDAVRVSAGPKGSDPEQREEAPSFHVPTSGEMPGSVRAYAP